MAIAILHIRQSLSIFILLKFTVKCYIGGQKHGPLTGTNNGELLKLEKHSPINQICGRSARNVKLGDLFIHQNQL